MQCSLDALYVITLKPNEIALFTPRDIPNSVLFILSAQIGTLCSRARLHMWLMSMLLRTFATTIRENDPNDQIKLETQRCCSTCIHLSPALWLLHSNRCINKLGAFFGGLDFFLQTSRLEKEYSHFIQISNLR